MVSQKKTSQKPDGRGDSVQVKLPETSTIYIQKKTSLTSLSPNEYIAIHTIYALIYNYTYYIYFQRIFCLAHCTDEDQKSETIVCS